MIDIKELIPFMRKGWVAMDMSGSWWWYSSKPELLKGEDNYGWLCDCWYNPNNNNLSEAFDIAPVEDWEKSLIKVEGKDE